jgi:uncharacterized integral membrane protein
MTDSAPQAPDEPTATAIPSGSLAHRQRPTRVSAAWMAVAVGLVLLLLLLIFIFQNSQRAELHFLWLEGSVPVGVALFAASVLGGGLVAIAGGSRIVQLRRSARQARNRAR